MAGKRKERKLTDAERRRLERFEATCDDLVAQGYRRMDLRVSIGAATVISVIAVVVLMAIAFPLFVIAHPEQELFGSGMDIVICLVAFVALICAHELIHGYTWSRFTPNGFKDVEFGVMWNALAPYCACNAPLKKGPYILGALMPLVTLGIIPLVVAFCIGSVPLLYIGALMVVGATGDILIVLKLLDHKSTATDVLLYDHPTEGGSVIFER